MNCVQVNLIQRRDDLLSTEIRTLWEMDFKDIKIEDTQGTSKENRYALSLLDNSVTLKDGHYELAAPWKSGAPSLPNNKPLATRRLSHLQQRLSKDDELWKKYVETMDGYVHKGYSKRAFIREASETGKMWYLPHHPVLSDKKPAKVRVVFDCAARYGGTSLNEQLLHGPDLSCNLVGVLCRFRQNQVAIVSDIECMFYQVNVRDQDRDCLRFLWWPSGDFTKLPEAYCMYCDVCHNIDEFIGAC